MPDRLKSFNEVLTDAVADLVANGFDSMERVQRWTRELHLAAERSLISPASLEQQLRDGLAAVYRRMVDQGDVFKYNPGVERFTLDRVKPELRAELDRRILASANLIRLNRDEAVAQTLRRFQGWSTSIPPGGVPAEKRSEVKENVRKSMASLPHSERFVLIDQGHKLIAAINDVVAADGGAIAARWRSNYRQPGYDYREDHKELDGQVFLIRDSWAHGAGLVKKGSAGYVDESVQPAQLPFCRCAFVYLYALRDLPDDMLTAKGRASLETAREAVKAAATTARSDGATYSQAEVAYRANWPNPATCCHRCSMFERGITINHCSAVDGEISATGHCSIFKVSEARTDSMEVKMTIPVPVDRDGIIPSLAVISKTGDRLYVDRSLPRVVEINGIRFDPAQIFWAREHALCLAVMKMTAAFLDQFSRHPEGPEFAQIYSDAWHNNALPAERSEAKRIGLDWLAWEAWCAGESARISQRYPWKPAAA